MSYVKKMGQLLSHLRMVINGGVRILLQITFGLLWIPLLALLIMTLGLQELLLSWTVSKQSAGNAIMTKLTEKELLQLIEDEERRLKEEEKDE